MSIRTRIRRLSARTARTTRKDNHNQTQAGVVVRTGVKAGGVGSSDNHNQTQAAGVVRTGVRAAHAASLRAE
jgi:hypothetical protein